MELLLTLAPWTFNLYQYKKYKILRTFLLFHNFSAFFLLIDVVWQFHNAFLFFLWLYGRSSADVQHSVDKALANVCATTSYSWSHTHFCGDNLTFFFNSKNVLHSIHSSKLAMLNMHKCAKKNESTEPNTNSKNIMFSVIQFYSIIT